MIDGPVAAKIVPSYLCCPRSHPDYVGSAASTHRRRSGVLNIDLDQRGSPLLTEPRISASWMPASLPPYSLPGLINGTFLRVILRFPVYGYPAEFSAICGRSDPDHGCSRMAD